MITIKADFSRGQCDVHAFGVVERSGAPVVFLFPDAFGQRPTSHALAEELAAQGWRVLMPDYFYEHAPYEPLEPKALQEGGPAQERLMVMFQSINQEKIDADVAALMALADDKLGSDAPLGAVGYCMGGRYAFTAACASDRIRFAAAIHAANLAPLEEDGPHCRFDRVKGRLYAAIASIDPLYDAAEHGRLAEALRAADTDHTIETYYGAAHGFVFSDLPIYDEAASMKHMRRLKENFSELFGA